MSWHRSNWRLLPMSFLGLMRQTLILWYDDTHLLDGPMVSSNKSSRIELSLFREIYFRAKSTHYARVLKNDTPEFTWSLFSLTSR